MKKPPCSAGRLFLALPKCSATMPKAKRFNTKQTVGKIMNRHSNTQRLKSRFSDFGNSITSFSRFCGRAGVLGLTCDGEEGYNTLCEAILRRDDPTFWRDFSSAFCRSDDAAAKFLWAFCPEIRKPAAIQTRPKFSVWTFLLGFLHRRRV